MISGVSEVSHYSIGYMFKERRYTSNLMYSSWRRKSFRVFKVACSIMKSRKAFWRTRAYFRTFIDNIGNKDLFQNNILKIESRKKKKERKKIVSLYYSTSKTYINRLLYAETVKASDPINSNGLSESVLKKKKNKQTNVVI